MNHEVESADSFSPQRRTTIVYGKFFAFIGIVGGLAMVFGTPGVLLLFHQGLGSASQEWVESMPGWAAPTALCIGMGGGTLIAVLSTCFGLLIPSRGHSRGRQGVANSQLAIVGENR